MAMAEPEAVQLQLQLSNPQSGALDAPDMDTARLLASFDERHRERPAWETQRAWEMTSDAHGQTIFCR
jgi:hypothetical protein